jgi:peptidoglycan L-alanyl-D-glutamate endopeptidase CwlK
MDGVHPLLISCVTLALRKYAQIDFGVGKGAVRTIEQQKVLLADGKSQTMNSKHLPQEDYYSHAVDLYPSGKNDISDAGDHAHIKWAMDMAAKDIGIELEHGYDWGWDAPHHEIKRIL